MGEERRGRRVSLPLHGKTLDLLAPPTIDAMRTRLGGRLAPPPRDGAPARAQAGDVVRTGDDVAPKVGVVLAADEQSVDVFAGGTVRRTRGAEVRPWLGEIAPELAQVAARARAFGALDEGAPVQFVRSDAEGALPELGVLVEKCRWGALVRRGDGVVLGVGFQRLAPIPRSDRPN